MRVLVQFLFFLKKDIKTFPKKLGFSKNKYIKNGRSLAFFTPEYPLHLKAIFILSINIGNIRFLAMNIDNLAMNMGNFIST